MPSSAPGTDSGNSGKPAPRSGRWLRAIRDWAGHAVVSAAAAGAVLYALDPSAVVWTLRQTWLSFAYRETLIAPLVITWAVMTLGGLTVLGTIRYFYVARRFQRALHELEERRDLVWSPQVESDLALMRKTAGDVAEFPFGVPAPAARPADFAAAEDAAIYLRGIELKNIRCFENLAIGLEDERGPYLTTVILGDNAAGKSTLLRSMALGLCPESDAVTLMRSLAGGFLRKGTDKGSIVLHLRSARGGFTGEIETTIEQLNGEIVRQKTWPADFPWDRIFVCGYGTNRSAGRPSSFETYAARLAVGSLFSNTADLLNPEVVLLRRDPETRRRFEVILKQVLLLEGAGAIQTTGNGIELSGPWGALPIAAMSDGYRSTVQWVLDYLGWQMFADRLRSPSMDGLLLIDELEQHLHPRWQRYILQRLRTQLDQTQIIATTHTPLVAAGVADLLRSQVIRLVPRNAGGMDAINIPPEELSGKRADQVLADAFGLITTKSPGTVAKIDRYSELLGRSRNSNEEQELETLKRELAEGWSIGDNAVQREADKAVSSVLDEMIAAGGQRQAVDAQVRQRLADLFGKTGSCSVSDSSSRRPGPGSVG